MGHGEIFARDLKLFWVCEVIYFVAVDEDEYFTAEIKRIDPPHTWRQKVADTFSAFCVMAIFYAFIRVILLVQK